VRIIDIADDALLNEVYAYLNTKDWPVYLDLVEELNMRILEIVVQAGTTLSLPARTLHIEQTDGASNAVISERLDISPLEPARFGMATYCT